MTARKEFHVGIVGGSLVGLSAAVAAGKANMAITAFERSSAGTQEGGGGLGVDVEVIQRVTGAMSSPPVCHGPDRDTTAWHLLRDWFERVVASWPSIKLCHDATVTKVIDRGSTIEVDPLDGRCWAGDVVIGLDGVHSTVCHFVDHDQHKCCVTQRVGRDCSSWVELAMAPYLERYWDQLTSISSTMRHVRSW